MNVTALVTPSGVVTVTFLAVRPVDAVTVKIAVTVVSFTTVKELAVTPAPPETLIDVAPARPVPLIVTGTLVPFAPVAGVIPVNTGTVNVYVTVPLVPPGVVTLMVLAPRAAVDVLVRVALMVVEFTTVTPLTVMPVVPVTFTVVPVVVKLVPVRTTATLSPRRPDAGEINVRVGTSGLTTVKVTALLVPLGVVTVTFLAVRPVDAVMVKVAVTVVALTTVKELTVTPDPPETLTAVVPIKLVPVRVTATLVP